MDFNSFLPYYVEVFLVFAHGSDCVQNIQVVWVIVTWQPAFAVVGAIEGIKPCIVILELSADIPYMVFPLLLLIIIIIIIMIIIIIIIIIIIMYLYPVCSNIDWNQNCQLLHKYGVLWNINYKYFWCCVFEVVVVIIVTNI
jgi:hypothetical protein